MGGGMEDTGLTVLQELCECDCWGVPRDGGGVVFWVYEGQV